jgi:hypothetical protein
MAVRAAVGLRLVNRFMAQRRTVTAREAPAVTEAPQS